MESHGSRRRVFFEVTPYRISYPFVQLLEIVCFRDDAFADGPRDVPPLGGILDDEENLGWTHRAQHNGPAGQREIPSLDEAPPGP